MNTAELLASNDERFLRVARELDERDWAAPSLCDGWTNRVVLAHLVLGYGAAVSRFAAGMVAARGCFDAANTNMSSALAVRRTPAELLDEFDRLRRHPRGIGRLFPRRLLLGDHVMHELDIMFALGRPADIPAETLAAVLDTEVGVPNPFVPAGRRARGLALRATDADWARPGEHTVSGAAADLASVLAGRPHALPRLTGPGVAELAGRLSSPENRS